MANIQNELNNIKNATFGKEVRGSIHDGIDAINKEVESTTSRQVDLESTFDQLVINEGNSNAEIVDARVKADGTSYSKLGDRLDSVDSQLEHVAIEVSKYGASPLLEDNSIYIQKALNETGIVMITEPGIYNTSGLVIKSNTTLILGKDVTLRLKNGSNQYLIVNEHWKKEETIWDENIHIVGGDFDFNKENNLNYNGNIQIGGYIGCGIVLNHINNFSVTNINKITNAKKYCIL